MFQDGSNGITTKLVANSDAHRRTQETPARVQRRRRTTGNPEGSNHIARLDAAASAPAHRDASRGKHQPDRCASESNCRRANNGSPEGLETHCAPRSTARPNLPTASSPKRRRDVNRQGSTAPGPHERLLTRTYVPTGCDVLLKEPYERSRWHIDGHRRRRPAAVDPEGDRHANAARAQVTAISERPEISSFELRQFHSFTPERFHALLNSLFRVLFNFPSRYLFAIGLVVVFSLWWSLPPTLGCTLKQPDSTGRAAPTRRAPVLRALHPLWARGSRVRSNLDIGVRKHGAKTTLP